MPRLSMAASAAMVRLTFGAMSYAAMVSFAV